jgi:DNA ligase (NAD+)
MAASVEDQIIKLRRELERHNELYYQGKPEISDLEFDALMRQLIELEQAHPQLITADSPSQRVGGQPVEGFKTVEHAVPMMSIDNTYDEAEVRAFDVRVRKALGESGKIAYVLEPKVDGVAASLRYEKGAFVLAATRGDGRRGDDITVNARTITSIPLRIRGDDPPDVLEVRGEIYMTNAVFQELNKQQEAAEEEIYKNPRNLAVGALKQLDPKITATRKLRFISHGLGECKPQFKTDSYFEILGILKGFGLKCPEHVRRVKTIDDVIQFIKSFATIRGSLAYQTDGIVVKVDSLAQRVRLGATSKAPKWVIAYKYQAEQAQTVLRDVEWQVGKLGTVTPVAKLEPVFLAGTTVQNASLHNRDQIRRLDLHFGDTVVIEKAGEIIPQVVTVLKKYRRPGACAVVPPSKCPSCQTALETEPVKEDMKAFWCINPDCELYLQRRQLKKIPKTCRLTRTERGCDQSVEEVDSMVALFCPNPRCPAQLLERLISFTGRGQMDIEGLGVELVEQLVACRKLRGFEDFFDLKSEDIANITREVVHNGKTVVQKVGEKTASKIIKSIELAKSRGLTRVLSGLGIPHVGTKVARDLAAWGGSAERLMNATQDQIREAIAPETLKNAKNEADLVFSSIHAKSEGSLFPSPTTIVPVTEPRETSKFLKKFEKAWVHKIKKSSISRLVQKFRETVTLFSASREDLCNAILGTPGIVAISLHKFLHSRDASEIFEELKKRGVKLSEATGVKTESIFSGKTVVITGTFESFSRNELTDRLTALGADVSTSVSGNTDLLLAGKEPGSKLAKAKELGTTVWNEQQLLDNLKGAS